MSRSPDLSFPVTTAGFDASGARLYAAHLRVEASLDEARDAVAALSARAADVVHCWVGPAGAAYAAGFARWQDGARLVLAALAESSAGLARAARDYDRAETANTAALLDGVR